MKVDQLYADMQAAMNAQHTRQFEAAFILALKSVVIDLNRTLRDEVAAPEDITSEDVGFPAYCDNVFHTGVKFYLQRSGQWAQEPDPQAFQFYSQQLRACIGPAILEIEDFPTR